MSAISLLPLGTLTHNLTTSHPHRYKKHSLAKSLSNKTDSELRSVLGAAASPRPVEGGSFGAGAGGRKRSSSQALEGGESVSTNTRQRSGSLASVSSTADKDERDERERKEKRERKLARKEKRRSADE